MDGEAYVAFLKDMGKRLHEEAARLKKGTEIVRDRSRRKADLCDQLYGWDAEDRAKQDKRRKVLSGMTVRLEALETDEEVVNLVLAYRTGAAATLEDAFVAAHGDHDDIDRIAKELHKMESVLMARFERQ